KLIRAANAQPGLSGVGTTYTANLPQLYLDIDRDQVKTLKVRLSDIFETLQIYVGSLYVNQINLFGRTWQVNVQAEAPFRLQEDDIARLQVRNQDGQMVRLGAVLRVRRVTGPERVSRYNMYPSADVMGATAPGTSSGQAIDMMNDLARRELPPSMTISWTDLYYQQIRAGNTSFYVFLFAAVMVMLVLAAQYESWFLPLAVILIVPLCILAAMAGVLSRGMDNNIFTQVGLLVLVGLAAKNAILIVEFAKQKRDEGVPAHAATVEAAGARLRPILMTSACFVHMVPLFFAVGAGAEMRRNLGTAVLCGAMGVTLFGIFLTPVFFYLIDWLATRLLGERVKTVLPADGVGPMPVAPPVPETAVTAQPPPG
ncbi:MAG TPA: efflux RND transporter permease subunit, partial [Gemmataceae bacterium]|nr:efflux RND transporter permease subunit [Gemmataceae bacterium]